MLKAIALAVALTAAAALPAMAGGGTKSSWPEIRSEVYGSRAILPGDGLLTLHAPNRATDDRRVPVEISAWAPEGGQLKSLTLVIDENPMPVSAVIDLAEPQTSAHFGFDLRLNGPSPVRILAETTDGRLYMTERMVKTSGLGACAAPPVGDPDAAIASIGQMRVVETPAPEGASAPRRARLEMRHPQHTGLQMDQISLLFIPPRYVHTLDVSADGTQLFHLIGSISLSEDPAIEFDPGAGAKSVTVRLEDTDGFVVERTMPLGHES